MGRQSEHMHPLGEIFAHAELFKQYPHKPYPDLQIGPVLLSGNSIDRITQEVKSRHAEWSTDPEAALVVVRSKLSAIKEIFERWEKRVGPPLNASARILGAWLCETAEQLTQDQFPELYSESSELWGLINHGTPGKGGADQISYFDDLCHKYATPPDFVKEQRQKLVMILRFFDGLKSEMLLDNEQRVVYEVLQNELIHQSPEQPGGKTLGEILSSTPLLMKYAGRLYYDEKMTLPMVWKRIEREAKGRVILDLTNYNSFKDAFYKFHRGRKKGK